LATTVGTSDCLSCVHGRISPLNEDLELEDEAMNTYQYRRLPAPTQTGVAHP
jgi:hypothetical protein